jgi:hypothetical protein
MRKVYSFVIAIPLAISLFYIGCARPIREEPSQREERQVGKMADKLWEKIQRENYRQNWRMWPDKEAFYPGMEPHGVLLITYVNNEAYDAITNKRGQMPNGSIIIKENYTEDRRLITITIMQKIKDFNSDENDWYWARFSPGGMVITMEEYGQTIKLAGKIDDCISCHSERSNNDYIFTGSLTEELPEIEKTIEEARIDDNDERIADKLWDKMQTERYQENWRMWPGKEIFYSGVAPHGTLLSTYINDTAYNAMVEAEEQLPHGSIIVKENYTTNKELIAITVMQKIENYNPDSNDWYWVQFGIDGNVITEEKYGETVLLADKVAGCFDCHARRKDNDYVFTSPLGETIPEIKREILSDEEIAKELWNTIERMSYQENWRLWPNKKAFYQGRVPHGPLITTYVNDLAYKAIVNKEKIMPIGAIIVQENYTKNEELAFVNVMNKRAYYSEKDRNWYWAQYAPDGEIMFPVEKAELVLAASRNVETCRDCHSRRINNDYLYTGYIRNF